MPSTFGIVGVPGKPIEQVHEIRRIILSPLEPAGPPLLDHAKPNSKADEDHVLWERPTDEQ